MKEVRALDDAEANAARKEEMARRLADVGDTCLHPGRQA
jgi:hypothetical protein